MRLFSCQCGNTVFFENSHCISCGHELGWCPACSSLVALSHDGNGGLSCSTCTTPLVKCHNYQKQHVCNRCVVPGADDVVPDPLCDYCRFNETIPDLSIEGNHELWRRLEAAKRRLLYTLDLIGLPYGNQADGVEPPLSFDFKADTAARTKWWWQMGEQERVYTGHAGGKITINILEADSVAREKARVSFEEAHRTIIGHFRHEIGHYYWEMLVTGDEIERFKTVFGDHENPTYSDALAAHYESGPPANWEQQFISSYATMHPWEDFAETFALYLDIVSVLDTARNMRLIAENTRDISCEEMIGLYRRLGVVLNEMNRAMGLIDLVPEVLVPAVEQKLGYVHHLVQGARQAVADR